MTKYILHGGSSNKPSLETDDFYHEMAISIADGTILLNYFSRNDDEVERLTTSTTLR
jgi:hypothetical protein